MAALPELTEMGTEATARLLGITSEWVRRLTQEGAIRKIGKDRYRVVDAVQGYIAYLKDEGRRTSKSAVASRLQEKRIEEADLRIVEKTKALQAAAQREALAVIDEYAGQLKSDLRSIPARVTDDLKLRRDIAERIDGAFGAAAKREAAAANLVEAAGDAVGAEGTPEPRRVGNKQPRLSRKPRKTGAA